MSRVCLVLCEGGFESLEDAATKTMEHKYIDYFRIDNSFSWPDQIQNAFEFVQHDNIFLEPKSYDEERFLDLCIKLEIVPFISKYGVFGCSKKEVGQHPFYYLEQKTTSSYPIRRFEDRGTGCPGDNRPCGNGTVQTEKILLTPKIMKLLDRLGIMSIPSAGVGSHILVTKRVKELLAKNAITGYCLIPCLEKGVSYLPEDYILEQANADLESRARYFQLIPTAKVLQYPNIGEMLEWRQCSTCGIVGMFKPHLIRGNTMFFQAKDLNVTDFQVCNGRRSDNIGIFNTKSEWIIVSGKLLRLLLDHEVRGLGAASWPRIEVEIVDIHLA